MPKLNKKFASKIGFFVVLLLFLFVFITQVNGAFIKVQLIMDLPGRTVTLEKVPTGAKLSSHTSCLPPKDVEINGKAIAAQDKKMVQCANGYMDAKVLTEKINDIKAGIMEMDLMLASLDRTKKYVKTASDGNYLGLLAIPAGLSILKKHDRTDPTSVAIQCVKGANGDIINGNVPVGTLISEQGVFFEIAPQSQINKIREIKKKNKELGQEIISMAAANEEIGVVKGILTGKKLQGLQKDLAQVTMPVTTTDVLLTHPEFKRSEEDTMGVSVGLTVDDKGVRVIPPWASSGTTQKLMGVFGITPPLYNATMNIDGLAYNFPNMVVPWNYLIAQTLEVIAQHQTRLTNLKTQYETYLKQLQKSYDALEAKNFNCFE